MKQGMSFKSNVISKVSGSPIKTTLPRDSVQLLDVPKPWSWPTHPGVIIQSFISLLAPENYFAGEAFKRFAALSGGETRWQLTSHEAGWRVFETCSRYRDVNSTPSHTIFPRRVYKVCTRTCSTTCEHEHSIQTKAVVLAGSRNHSDAATTSFPSLDGRRGQPHAVGYNFFSIFYPWKRR